LTYQLRHMAPRELGI